MAHENAVLSCSVHVFPDVVVSKLPLIVCRLYIIHQILAVPHLAIPRGPFGPANTHSCLQDTAQDLVIDGKWKEPTIRRLQETLEKLCLSMVRKEFSFMYRETSSIKRGSSTEEVYEFIEHI